MNLSKYIEDIKEYTIQTRRYLHTHPEPSLAEYETAKFIEAELDKLGIKHQRVGETGVYASIKGNEDNGKVLVIRADIDALKIQDLKDNCPYKSVNEGIMHACGHDAHTASLLSTVKLLNNSRDSFKGEIRFFFQQSEENGQGARQFVKAGLLENATRVIGYHGSSDLDVGTVSCTPGPNNASCDYFKIVIKGKSAHVSQPHKSIDALYIASQLVVNLQSIVSRSTNPIDTVVVGIGVLKAGTTYNIVANEAIIEGTTRTFSKESREKTNSLITKYATELAEMYGGSAEVVFENYANPLINNEMVANELADIARNIVGKENVIQNQEKRLGADDFADFLQVVDGCYMFIGTRNDTDPNTAVAHHHGLFDIDENSMLIAVNIFIEYVKWYLA